MTDVVRTRFAPSPTGYLHIGGARTALFNYLLARRLGGRFAVRIEDTDQARHVPDAEGRLLDDMLWLGLEWDEGPRVGGPHGPYHQSQRLEHYREHARRLLDEGKAYYAFDTREELEAMRAAAQREKRGFRYPRPARFPSERDAQRARAEGRPVVVRLRMPEQDYVIRDTILGDVSVRAQEMDDFVCIKGDGWPTYHFAVVVDDELMRVTHVLRGQEHLINTANHLALQQCFGYRTPVYAHLPIILNMSGSKMSKRDNDKLVRQAVRTASAAGKLTPAQLAEIAGCDAETAARWLEGDVQLDDAALRAVARRVGVVLPEIQIHDFRVSGYLPEVLLNFIALLGWSAGDDREKYTLDELCAVFSVERIGRTNARFDRDKLLNFNTTALAAAPAERKLAGLRDYLAVNEQSPLRGLGDDVLAKLIEISPTARIFRDIDEKAAALFVPDDRLEYDPDAVDKVLTRGDRAGLKTLAAVRDALARLGDWSAAELERALRAYSESSGQGLGKVAQPIRVAVTGTTVSPPIFDTLALLGRERSLARIDAALRRSGG
ncbi:MAG: glutamate--tRNA ligase [Phycisphaerae bacterium]|jgi:glutamyl-tRNA synthetase|nr:glutamate--tRNA ligase [Phycisphaerae bacterium]MCZ2399172.1 glutamate--tRNA ligase [Phycisphaerae bacterium]